MRDGDLELRPTSGSANFIGFAVHHRGERVGTIALAPAPGKQGRHEGSVRWNLKDGPGRAKASAILTMVIEFAFAELKWVRVETRVTEGDTENWRAASIAGLRREGILRRPEPQAAQMLMARLATDPPVLSKEGFVAILNAGLPRKRVIGQGLLRNERGEYLLCELTYKSEWDLPGGVIENDEAPGFGLTREIEEELGITLPAGEMVTMNWLPAWRAWDDACLFVFDLGTTTSDIVEKMVLQKSEIAAVHWCDLARVGRHATGATIELLTAYEAGTLERYREAPKQPE